MVVAGPGTGKTELLSVRVASILERTDTAPENILCLTFTDAGAQAMRQRLIGIIGADAYRVAIHTFHSFAADVIANNREYFYRGAEFELADDLKRFELIRSILSDLPHNDPLSAVHDGEFTEQGRITNSIIDLKKSGLAGDELRAIIDQTQIGLDQTERLIVPVLNDRVSKAVLDKIAQILPELATIANQYEPLYQSTPITTVVYHSLLEAYNDAVADNNSTKPISVWKSKWLTNYNGNKVLSPRKSLTKLSSLAHIYEEYLNRMDKAGWYDFDDMILQLVHAIEVNEDLRLNLQEKYLYLMVDEFQDTNLAQMRIIHSLTDNPVNEGRPNVMVVGDDDQAIYSFQGADVSNILNFRHHFPAVEMIPLIDNYRSRTGILDKARSIITRAEERLESQVEELDKTLTAHRDGEAIVHVAKAESYTCERRWLVDTIKQKLTNGTPAENIVVLARKHPHLIELLPHFANAGIPVHYEKQNDALESETVRTVELVARVVTAIARSDFDTANSLMPELLAHPAWGLEPKSIWQLSIDAYKSRQLWLEVMATNSDLQSIHEWLINLAQASLREPLEPMIDMIIGRPKEDDTETHYRPFYEHYFGGNKLATNPADYIDHLSSLQAIRAKLREHIDITDPTLSDMLSFIEDSRRIKAKVSTSRTVGGDGQGAVHLMTAHAAKGLEYPTVFVVHVNDNVWGSTVKPNNNRLTYPVNLPIGPAGDSFDERLRLFYVAITRAEHELYLSFSETGDNGKSILPASFLVDHEPDHHETTTDTETALETAEVAWYYPLVQPSVDLATILQSSLEKYKLSVTHLNNFIDIQYAGPQTFLTNNLLRFPAAKSAASAYGSAVHRALQNAHVHLTIHGEKKPLEDVLHDYETQLRQERLSDHDFNYYLQKGTEHLSRFIEQRYDTFSADQKSELDFSYQDVHVGEAHITGKIDIAEIDQPNRSIHVVDYKTGKAPTDNRAALKLHKYKQQLLFYKLLVENSRDYRNYTVDSGCLTFVEATDSGEIIDWQIPYTAEDLEHVANLIQAVWRRIINLDLPDTSHYPKTLKGVKQFEQDLIDGTI